MYTSKRDGECDDSRARGRERVSLRGTQYFSLQPPGLRDLFVCVYGLPTECTPPVVNTVVSVSENNGYYYLVKLQICYNVTAN